MTEGGDGTTKAILDVTCPCCRAALSVDARSGLVVDAKEPADPRTEKELSEAVRLLEEEKAKVHDKFRQIVEADKGRTARMDQLFKDFMGKAKDEPVGKPLRNVDLD
jgi:hypothetical protein